MKLCFLGTRGNIEPRTQAHYRHSTTMITYYHRQVMLDCGEDWLEKLPDLAPNAIVVTHAHPDHAWGLKNGAPCPVYATQRAWKDLDGYPIEHRETITCREPIEIEGMTFEAFAVDHSTRAPAVGYRVTAGRVAIFYVPDVVWIHDRDEALAGAKLYVGDGATVTRSMVRKSHGVLIGHAPLRTQLTWCQQLDVPRAILTHLGSVIVQTDPQGVAARVNKLAEERGVEAQIAHDGMEIVLR